jgi:hypothetical protein
MTTILSCTTPLTAFTNCCFKILLQQYAAQTTYSTATGELIQPGPFPLVMQVLQLKPPTAAPLGLQCPGVLTCEEGIVPQEVFLQRAG